MARWDNETYELCERLNKWYTGDIHDCMDLLGIWGVLDGLSLYGQLPESGSVCGPAMTVQFVPTDKKVFSKNYHAAIDDIKEGGVMVVDTGGARGSCTGEILCTGAKTRGAVATVVGGTIRDVAQVEELGYPAYAAGVLPVTAVGRMEDVARDVDITIGGVRIKPGDIVFGDRDGVLVIPRAVAPLVADMADDLGREEGNWKSQILAGRKLREIFDYKYVDD